VDRDVPIAISSLKNRAGTARSTFALAKSHNSSYSGVEKPKDVGMTGEERLKHKKTGGLLRSRRLVKDNREVI
jgi:hypothetical protein